MGPDFDKMVKKIKMILKLAVVYYAYDSFCCFVGSIVKHRIRKAPTTDNLVFGSFRPEKAGKMEIY